MVPIQISLSAPEVERPHDSGAFPRPESKKAKQAEARKKKRDFINEHGMHPDDEKAPKEDEPEKEETETKPSVKTFEESDLADMSGSQIQDLHDLHS